MDVADLPAQLRRFILICADIGDIRKLRDLVGPLVGSLAHMTIIAYAHTLAQLGDSVGTAERTMA